MGRREKEKDGRYLIIRGDKSLEEISRALEKEGQRFKEITTYSTSPRTDIQSSIETSVAEYERDREIWFGFFSPSSASYVLQHLSTLLLAEEQTRIFAIGETTAVYLKQRGVGVHAIAKQPTPEGTIHAINKYRAST